MQRHSFYLYRVHVSFFIWTRFSFLCAMRWKNHQCFNFNVHPKENWKSFFYTNKSQNVTRYLLSVDWSFPRTPHLTSSSPTSPDYWRDEWGKAIPGLWWLILHLCAPPSHLFSRGMCRWTVLGVKLFSCYLPYIKMTQHSFFMGKNHLILFHEEDRIEMADWTPSLSK